jgi:hypothetical protein
MISFLLYKVFNSNDPSKDWLDLTNQIICTRRQTTFETFKYCNYKIGNNILANKIKCINQKIQLDFLNLPYPSFKYEMKNVFLVYERWMHQVINCVPIVVVIFILFILFILLLLLFLLPNIIVCGAILTITMWWWWYWIKFFQIQFKSSWRPHCFLCYWPLDRPRSFSTAVNFYSM